MKKTVDLDNKFCKTNLASKLELELAVKQWATQMLFYIDFMSVVGDCAAFLYENLFFLLLKQAEKNAWKFFLCC